MRKLIKWWLVRRALKRCDVYADRLEALYRKNAAPGQIAEARRQFEICTWALKVERAA